MPFPTSIGSAQKPLKFDPLLDHVFWNGLGFNFLGETTVALLALHYGATNFQMGLLGSLGLLSGLLLIFYPWFYQNRDPVKLYQNAWNLRGWICLGYLLTVLLSNQQAVWLILVIYGLFAIIRMSGVAMFPILQKRLSSPKTQGLLLSRMSIRFNSSTVISRLLSTWILKIEIFSSVLGLFFIQALGFFANALAARSLDRIAPMSPLRLGKTPPLWKRLRLPWENKSRSKILSAHIANHGLMILMSFFIPTLVNLAHFEKAGIFLFALLTALGGVASGFFLEKVFHLFRAKVLMSFFYGCYALCLLGWIWVPMSSGLWLFYLLGGLTSFTFSVASTVVNRAYLTSLPTTKTIAYTSGTYFYIAVIALCLGFSIGPLAQLGKGIRLPLTHENSWVFLAALILTVFNLGMTMMFDEQKKEA